MSTTSIATVIIHPAHKVAPILSDGITTPSALLDWENACDDFFHGTKDPITDDKKVSKVTSGLQNSHISVYVRNNRACLHALTFPDFMGELCETFLPAGWGKDTLWKILAARMSLDQTFYNFCTDIIMSNNLLAHGPLYLTDECIKEQVFNNVTEDLHDKLEESPDELVEINKLPLQKWLNAISEIDIKMVKAIKCNTKHLAVELEKEEKKRRNLVSSLHNVNTTVNTSSSTDHCQSFPVNNYNKSHGTLPLLAEEERSLLYKHRGCFKCRHLYAGHMGHDCLNDFPETHTLITPALAATAKTKFKKVCHPYRGGSFNRGPAPSTSTPAIAAVVEESSDISGDENKKSSIVAMTWPSAVVLGDSDSDESVSPPLTLPNLFWDASAIGRDGFFVPVKAMLDNGAHIVLIRPDVVEKLGLE